MHINYISYRVHCSNVNKNVLRSIIEYEITGNMSCVQISINKQRIQNTDM